MEAEMKTLIIGETTFNLVDSLAVRCCSQELTEEQKSQARSNIGAAAIGGGGGGGGGAAVEPVVFTLNAETGEVACNKNYAEALAMFNDRQLSAALFMPAEGADTLCACLLAMFSMDTIIYAFMAGEGTMAIYYTPDGAMLGEM